MNKQNKVLLELTVNGDAHTAVIEPQWTLARVLRVGCGLTGAKEACNEGACGSCTVIIEGEAVASCMLFAIEQQGKNIKTIEGLLTKNGELHPIQEAWLEEYGAQCGFCSSGMILSTKALLDRVSNPTDSEIKEALGGNICICSNYEHIFNAVRSAIKKMTKDTNNE